MKTRLNINSTPGEILGALMDYIPFLTNITEILNDLHSLGLSKDCIKRVLSGGSACVFGDIASPKFSNRKVIVSSALVSLAEIEGTYQVCLDGLPVDAYIAQEIQRQKNLESASKEELAREIRILRSKVETSAEQIKALEDHIRTLKAGFQKLLQ